MLFPINNRPELEDLEELASLQNEVEETRLQDKLGKQYFHEDTKNYLNDLLIQLKIPLKI